MKKKCFFMLLMVMISLNFSVAYASKTKVISVVYDDSMSVMNNSAQYNGALQMITASLENEDRLNVVKMSRALGNNDISLVPAKRRYHMMEMKNYQHIGMDSVSAVNTATNWLLEQISYSDENLYKLIIISDSTFVENNQSTIENCIQQIKLSFFNLDWEVIFLNVGNQPNKKINDATYITLDNTQVMETEFLEDLGFVKDGVAENIIVAEKKNDVAVRIITKQDLRRIMVCFQTNENKFWSVKRNGKLLDVETYNIDTLVDSLNGSITHIFEENNNKLESGEYEIEFFYPVEIDQVTFLCDYEEQQADNSDVNIVAKINILDENNIISQSGDNYLLSDKPINVKCELYNAESNNKISDEELANITSIRIADGKRTYKMYFDKNENAYIGQTAIFGDEVSNDVYVETVISNSHTILSNTLHINVEQKNEYEDDSEIIISHSNDIEYKFVKTIGVSLEKDNVEFRGKQKTVFKFLDVPYGVLIECDGKKYRNNDEITIFAEKGEVTFFNIYANCDYRETEIKNMRVKIIENGIGTVQNHNWVGTNSSELKFSIIPKFESINVQVLENIEDLKLEHSFSEKDKYVAKVNFYIEDMLVKNITNTIEVHLIEVPKGISIEYENKKYRNNEKIPINVDDDKKYELKIYTNSDYREKNERNLILKLKSDKINQEIFLNGSKDSELVMKVIPVIYPIKIFNKNSDKLDIQNEKIELEIAMVDNENSNILEMIGVMNVKNIENNSSFFEGFTYSITKNEENNTLDLEVKPNFFTWIKGNTLNLDITVAFNDTDEIATFNQNIIVTNIDMIVILKPLILMCAFIVFCMGYILKLKFDDNAQIIVNEDGDIMEYGLSPKLITVLIPYVAHKTKIGAVEFKAAKNKEVIASVKDFNVLKINGENVSEYIKTNHFNKNRIRMTKNKSSFSIETYDGEESYEYLDCNYMESDQI